MDDEESHGLGSPIKRFFAIAQNDKKELLYGLIAKKPLNLGNGYSSLPVKWVI
jgi:hypothetical protein